MWLSLGLLLGESRALAYPYGALRPGDQVMAGPTDGHVSAIHFNPAALRLSSGSHILAVAGARATLGSYGRDTPLPAGFDPRQAGAQAADPVALGWAVSDMMVAASWDLRTEAVTLGALDPAMAERGKATFEMKCSACHKFDARYVGPSLGGVMERRTPAYIMNMILAPEEMYTKHPAAKQLLAELMTQMPNTGLTRDQAREVVEYLRTVPPTPSGQ